MTDGCFVYAYPAGYGVGTVLKAIAIDADRDRSEPHHGTPRHVRLTGGEK